MSNSNSAVIQAFLDRKPLRAANLSSDGQSLWSYGWWQVAQHLNTNNTTPHCIIVRNGPAYSQSTATHRGRLNSALAFRNHQYSETPPTNPITVINSEYTPSPLGHMRLVDLAERVK